MTEIYLDSAATSLHKPPQVAQAVAEAICKAGNAARGAHGASLSALRTVYDTRCLAARLLGCPRPDHVVFAANSTMALNIAICGLLSPGDHAISTDLEHNSVLRPLYALQRQGMALSFVPADKNGQVSYDAFERLFRPNTRAVVCTHASNVTGDVLDIPRIAAMAHRRGALLILDASQTAGAIPLDMTALGADVVCFTGHKSLLGPQGTGGLCIRPGVEVRPLLRGGSGVHSFDRDQPAAYPTRLEAGTLNRLGFAGVILLGALLLMLPLSTTAGCVTPFHEALFTATSAVCVTGLVVQDTGSYWSGFGQVVILTLIQIGGLGVVTVAASVALLSGRRISLMQRSTMQDAISAPKVGGIVRLTRFILRGNISDRTGRCACHAAGAVKTAATILMMYLALFFGGGVFISVYENLPLSSCLYEAASAVGTVGLTLGITPQLHIPSQMVLIALMYLGRVGGLTLIYAAVSSKKTGSAKLPQESITIG